MDQSILSVNFMYLKVLIHDPYAYPYVIGRGMAVGIGQEAFVAVNAQKRER